MFCCTQGAVRDGANATALELTSDAGDGVVPPNLRGAGAGAGAKLDVVFLGEGEDAKCIALLYPCTEGSQCCSQARWGTLFVWKVFAEGIEIRRARMILPLALRLVIAASAALADARALPAATGQRVADACQSLLLRSRRLKLEAGLTEVRVKRFEMLIASSFLIKAYLCCTQGAVGEGAEAAVLEMTSDAGVGVPTNLRGANLVDSSLGEGEGAMCKAGGESCSIRWTSQCCSGFCFCFGRYSGCSCRFGADASM